MKVKNEYVEISSGQRNIKIQNTILDTYLKEIPKIQFQREEVPTDISLSQIYFKFDTDIDVKPDMIVKTSDFDYSSSHTTRSSSHKGSTIVVDYTYLLEDLSIHIGKKITAIGFGFISGSGYKVGAIVDTRNYNIYIDKKNEIKVSRRDIFSTDGIFYGSNVDGIMHMFPLMTSGWRANTDYKWGVLKSVGLGISTNKIVEEYEFNNYNNELTIKDFGFDIDREFTIEHLNEGLFPEQSIYPSEEIYPERIIRKPIYPDINIYPRFRRISYGGSLSIYTIKISNISGYRWVIADSRSIR